MNGTVKSGLWAAAISLVMVGGVTVVILAGYQMGKPHVPDGSLPAEPTAVATDHEDAATNADPRSPQAIRAAIKYYFEQTADDPTGLEILSVRPWPENKENHSMIIMVVARLKNQFGALQRDEYMLFYHTDLRVVTDSAAKPRH